MERVMTDELQSHVGRRARIAGWLHHQRKLGQVSFLLVRDRAGIAQVVMTEVSDREAASDLLPETVLEVVGDVVASEQAPSGVELQSVQVSIIAAPAIAPPFELRRDKIPAQLPTLLDHAAVALRHPQRRAIAAIAAASVHGFRACLDGLHFTEVHTPKVVAAATEGGANVFPIDWFGRTAYLAQSPQFYKQVMVGVFERVYEVAPVFRAEPHDTARHLAEYVSLDAEMGFIEDHTDVMALLRDVIAAMLQAVAERARSSVELLGLELPAIPSQIPTIDFYAAQELIEADTQEQVLGQLDLAPGHERWLCEWAKREHGSEFLYIVGYPLAKRPFYTHPNPKKAESSNGFDLLFRGLELVTGGQRLHRYGDYMDALAGTDLGPYEGYLEAFRHGMPPHGGFAIGLERWTARLTGAANVREVTLFPRDVNRVTP